MLDKGIHKKYGRIIKSDSKRYSFIEGTPVRRLWRNFLALCNYMDENNKNFVYCQEYHSFAVYFVNVMPEIDSFYCIIKILTKILPAYFNPKTTALEIGGNVFFNFFFNFSKFFVKLVMESIELLDPALDKHMKSIGFQINFCCMSMLKTLTLLIYNMKSSLRLLDLILVAGPPVIIISLIAKIISKRNCILEFNNSGECFALFQQMKYSEEIDEDGMAHIYFALREEKKLYKKILDLHK
ncbi:CDC16 protein [Bonamia ostreae]|uniref:CDC16 protein n=1 Tax=Bonamia ostreae TaxID=126728 RepID=A0ABV2AI95_9EUKA